jgi:hypothetical protein
MMEEARKGVAQLVRELVGEGSSIGIISGTGNNAGDGFVAATYLSDIMEVTVILARPSERMRIKLALKNYEKVRDLSVEEKVDIISDGERVRRNRTRNPSMSVEGTGDTLTGIMVGLLTKGVEPFDAARIASFTNGYAGDLAFESLGYGMMASDLVDRIPDVLKICLEKVL